MSFLEHQLLGYLRDAPLRQREKDLISLAVKEAIDKLISVRVDYESWAKTKKEIIKIASFLFRISTNIEYARIAEQATAAKDIEIRVLSKEWCIKRNCKIERFAGEFYKDYWHRQR